MDTFYNIIDINNYNQHNMKSLLDNIILYYRQPHKINKVQFKYPRQMGKYYVDSNSNLNSNSNNNMNGNTRRLKTKKKNTFLDEIIKSKKKLKRKNTI